jgi:hypothetical protein
MRAAWLLLLLTARAAAQSDLPFTFDPERALDHIAALASDFFAGRHSGFPGGDRAEAYCARCFQDLGLEPGGTEGYLHPFTYPAARPLPPVRLGAPDGAGPDLVLHQDYELLLYTGERVVPAATPVGTVFVGYGLHEPDLGWDDYAGLDVRGKAVLCLRGLPVQDEQRFPEQRLIGYKTSTARDLGAVAVLMAEGDRAITGTIQARYHRADLAGFWISRGCMDRFLVSQGESVESLQTRIRQDQRPCSMELPHTISFMVHSTFQEAAAANNVLAVLPGTTRADEYILIGAHLDHLGVGPDGQVFNGADDNASGTAVLLELARAFVVGGVQPDRSIIFAAWGAEEQGLVGSTRYAETPVVPLSRIMAVLNMDMVGLGNGQVNFAGLDRFPWFRRLLDDYGIPGAGGLPRDGALAWGSDHQPFQLRGVPAFSFSSRGRHPHYHQPGDDTGTIRPECLAAVGTRVGAVALYLADLDRSLTIEHRYERYQADQLTRLCSRPWPAGEDLTVVRQVRDEGFAGLHLLVDDLSELERLLQLAQREPEAYQPCATLAEFQSRGRALALFLEPHGALANRQALLAHLPVLQVSRPPLTAVPLLPIEDLAERVAAAEAAAAGGRVTLQLEPGQEVIGVLTELLAAGWEADRLRGLAGGNLLNQLVR